MILDALRIGGLVFLVAILQTAIFTDAVILGGAPDVLLVTLVAVGLGRGSTAGAAAGFLGGLLVDVATLGTMGLTSLVLTLVGYWAGRLDEIVVRGRQYLPYATVAVMTLLYPCGILAVRFLLGEAAPARAVLVDVFFQTLVLNLLLTWPVWRLAAWILPSRDTAGVSTGARVIG